MEGYFRLFALVLLPVAVAGVWLGTDWLAFRSIITYGTFLVFVAVVFPREPK